MNLRPIRPDPARMAQIGTAVPLWHIARIQPGREAIALAHLAAHGFGAYLPIHDRRDDKTTRQLPLLPGYCLVFLRDLARDIANIRTFPGISGLMVDADGVPVSIPDSVIRTVENIEFGNWIANLPRSYFRRRRRHETWIIPHWRNPNHAVAA